MNSPAATLRPTVEAGGYRLVEEDDVAFSLSLCREVHRIYGSYQSGELEGTDAVHVGLALTAQMLSTLSCSVKKGMPAMRISVAWAQTAEMMAVMFGEQLSSAQPSGRRLRSGQQVPRIEAGPTPAVAPPATALSPAAPGLAPAAPSAPAAPATPSVGRPTRDPSAETAAAAPDRLTGLKLWYARRSMSLRFLIGAVATVLAAALIDAPIVALLLFPDLSLQLSAGYATVGIAAWAYRRRLLPVGRRPELSHP